MLKALFIFSALCCLANSEESVSGPLILTPYLNQKRFQEARELARVTPDMGDVLSYSGYFTVNKHVVCDGNLFFWFFPAVKDWETAPVVLWLQGGPGSSSMYGLFELIGPFNSLPEGLKARDTSWTTFANVIFIDNPVGTGFSFTTGKCYPHDITTVSKDLHSGLTQFFQLFPELQKNNFFLAGESFAGHYIPALAFLIHKRNSNKKSRINLKGLIMGNPVVNVECHDYAGFLYQVGLADLALRNQLYGLQKKIKKRIKRKNYRGANKIWDYILSEVIDKKIGAMSKYTILTEPADPSTYATFLNTFEIRNQVHAGTQEFVDFNEDVYENLSDTLAQSSSTYLEKLLQTEKYKVVFYSGNLDIICMYTSAECVMRGLVWSGRKKYLKAPRNIWYLDDKVVGWYKSSKNLLVDIVVKDAQHAAIYSQPEVTYRMMKSIVTAKPDQNPLWALQNSVSSNQEHKEELFA